MVFCFPHDFFDLELAHLLIKTHNPTVMALLETKISGSRANEVCKNLNFSNWVRIEAIGYSGGIWIFWKKDMDVSVCLMHP